MIHRKAAKTKRSHPGKKSQIDPDLKPPQRDRTPSVLQLQRIIGNQAIGRLIQTPMKIGRPNLRPLTAPTPSTTFRVVQRKKSTRRKASEKAAAEIVKLLEELHGIITLKLATSSDFHKKIIFNIGWIDSLTRLKGQIDNEFSEKKQSRAFERYLKRDKQRRAIISKARKTKKSIKDKATRAELDKKLKEALAGYDKKLREEFIVIPIKPRAVKSTSVAVPKSGVTWEEGRTLGRLNFMATFTAVLGSVDKVKAHFQGIREVNISKKLFLSKEAATRLEKARDVFEKQHPGWKFPQTTVGQSLRNRHQQRHSSGMLGHPLGLAIDYYAFENPHLKGSRFLLETITGGPASLEFRDRKGNILSYSQRRAIIRELGRHTMAGKAPGTRWKRVQELLSQFDKAHTAMVDSSKRFQASLPEESKKALAAEAEKYWSGPQKEIVELRKRLKKNEIRLKPARQKALRNIIRRQRKEYRARAKKMTQLERLQMKMRHAEITPQMIDEEPVVASILVSMKADGERLENILQSFQTKLKKLFEPFIHKIDQEITTAKAPFKDADLSSLPAHKRIQKASKELKRIKMGKSRSTERRKQLMLNKLEKLRMKYPEIFKGRKIAIDESSVLAGDPVKLKSDMLKHLDHLFRMQGAKSRIGRLNHLKDRLLNDLDFAFGQRRKKEHMGGHARQTGDPSVLQLLELGFIRDDPVPDPGTGKPKKRQVVFNREFFRVMIEHGFDPGAAWGAVDTMHFDFVEGFGAIKQSKGTFGPEGFRPKK
jgi:hypothetical protein